MNFKTAAKIIFFIQPTLRCIGGLRKELRNVVKTTQMIAVDIDKIPAEKMKEVVQKADADPHTMMRFITVSQRGLRIISRYLPIDDDEVTALELFDVIIR